jgi:hypothetical protein
MHLRIDSLSIRSRFALEMLPMGALDSLFTHSIRSLDWLSIPSRLAQFTLDSLQTRSRFVLHLVSIRFRFACDSLQIRSGFRFPLVRHSLESRSIPVDLFVVCPRFAHHTFSIPSGFAFDSHSIRSWSQFALDSIRFALNFHSTRTQLRLASNRFAIDRFSIRTHHSRFTFHVHSRFGLDSLSNRSRFVVDSI